MVITRVNGTPLQAAIDKANKGDTLSVASGIYAGGLSLMGKDLAIYADSQVILDGPQRDGQANFDIDQAKFDIRGLDLRHGGAAFRITGDCRGAYIGQCSIPVVDFMMRNTPSPTSDDNGGNAFQLTKREGTSGVAARNITIEDVQVRSARAPSADYKRDGGWFEVYAGIQNVTARRCEVWDSVNIFESGKGASDPLNTSVLIEDCKFHGRPNPLASPTDTTVANGFYVRAINGLTVQRCEFDLLDWWMFTFITSGGFGSGGVSNVKILENTFRLAPGMSRIIATDAGVPVSAIMLDRSRIYVSDANTTIAKIGGTDNIKTLAAMRALAPSWEANNVFFGKEPPADPCAALVAAADARTSAALARATAAETQAAVVGAQLADFRAAFEKFSNIVTGG